MASMDDRSQGLPRSDIKSSGPAAAIGAGTDPLAGISIPTALPPTTGSLISTVLDTTKCHDSRSTAIKSLAKIADSIAVQALITVLRDTEVEIRRKAVEALWQIGDVAAGPALITALREDVDGGVRSAAARALGWIGAANEGRKYPAAVSPLITALKDESPGVRWSAVEGLCNLKDPAAYQPLITVLKDEEEAVREHAGVALGLMGERIANPVVSGLIDALRGETKEVRRAAAAALGEIGDERAVPALIDVLRRKDEDVGVHDATVWALGKIKNQNAVQIISEALNHENRGVRTKAARAIGEIFDQGEVERERPRLIRQLSDMLQDDDNYIRRAAAEALGKIKDPAAVPALIAALKDKDGGVLEAATEALGKIKDPRAVQALASVMQIRLGHDEYYPLLVAQTLVQIGVPAVPALIQTLKRLEKLDHRTARCAAWALGEIGDVRAVPALISMMRGEIRCEVALALGRIGDKRAVPALMTALKAPQHPLYGPDEEFQRCAAEGLGMIKDTRAIPALFAAAEDFFRRPSVKVAAIRALGEIKDPRVAQFLRELHPRSLDIEEAIQAALQQNERAEPVKEQPERRGFLSWIRDSFFGL